MNKPNPSSAPRLTGRRRLLTALAAGGGVVVARKGLPEHWGNPVVDAVSLPAHAAATGDAFTGSRTLSVSIMNGLGVTLPRSSGDVGGLANFFDSPFPQQAPNVGIAGRLSGLVVSNAHADPGLTMVTLEGFAQVAGNTVTLLQLRFTIRVEIDGGTKECEQDIDETIQLLYQRTNMPAGGPPVAMSPVNCSEGGGNARVVSITPSAVVVELVNGTTESLVLNPGGSPFPIPADCKDQTDALEEAIEEAECVLAPIGP